MKKFSAFIFVAALIFSNGDAASIYAQGTTEKPKVGSADDKKQMSDEDSDPVIDVKDSDKQMNDAIAKAKATFPLFVKNWKEMPSDITSVKIAVSTADDELEHIWFTPSVITETTITGTCGNAPANVPDLRLGDERTFDRSKITDWMIMADRKCYGGYTIRVLVERSPESAPPLEFAELEEGAEKQNTEPDAAKGRR